tara:strand:+ start:220 stop:492 length:273 start_codon:yes stop_codon:yes gene_type:complete
MNNMKIKLVRTCLQKIDVSEDELINYIKGLHRRCEQKYCDINRAIENNLPDRELIDLWLDTDGVEGLALEGFVEWSEVPNSEDRTALEIL